MHRRKQRLNIPKDLISCTLTTVRWIPDPSPDPFPPEPKPDPFPPPKPPPSPQPIPKPDPPPKPPTPQIEPASIRCCTSMQ